VYTPVSLHSIRITARSKTCFFCPHLGTATTDPEPGHRHSHVRDYVRVNQAAIREMYRQVGDLDIDKHGLARRGLLVRHLVLPNGIAGTAEGVRFFTEETLIATTAAAVDIARTTESAGAYPRALTRGEDGGCSLVGSSSMSGNAEPNFEVKGDDLLEQSKFIVRARPRRAASSHDGSGASR
jgi:hypothetical protein